MSLSIAIVIAIVTMYPAMPVPAATEPVYQTSNCKVGYTWDEKKQKCVRKGLDY